MNFNSWQDDQSMSKNNTQEKLYKMLEKLKGMARQVPPKYQARLSFEMLSSLAALLLDDTVLQIVAELTELQHMTEKHLHQTRCSLISRHKAEIDRITSEHKETLDRARCGGRHHAIPHLLSSQQQDMKQLTAMHQKEIKQFDTNILLTLDKKVEEQQSTLEKVGVPGFFVTSNPLDVRVQQYIINFILKLAKYHPAIARACN